MSIESVSVACKTCGALKVEVGGDSWRWRREMVGGSNCILRDGIFCSPKCEPEKYATAKRLDLP